MLQALIKATKEIASGKEQGRSAAVFSPDLLVDLSFDEFFSHSGFFLIFEKRNSRLVAAGLGCPVQSLLLALLK